MNPHSKSQDRGVVERACKGGFKEKGLNLPSRSLLELHAQPARDSYHSYLSSVEVAAIERSWGLKTGTLGLEFNGNKAFDYSDKAWVILPEESMVARFFHDTRQVLVRKGESFPNIVNTFSYTVFNFGDIDTLTRQTQNWDDATTGNPIKSHIHPTYAILNTGSILASRFEAHTRESLFEKVPVLSKIFRLYTRWLAPRIDLGSLLSTVQREKLALDTSTRDTQSIRITPGPRDNGGGALIGTVNRTAQKTTFPLKVMPLNPDSLKELDTRNEWDPPFWSEESIASWALGNTSFL